MSANVTAVDDYFQVASIPKDEEFATDYRVGHLMTLNLYIGRMRYTVPGRNNSQFQNNKVFKNLIRLVIFFYFCLFGFYTEKLSFQNIFQMFELDEIFLL